MAPITESRKLFFLFSYLANALILPRKKNATKITVEEYEYIVVGSGAGGGPVASRLGFAGHTVFLIDAGEDEGNRTDYRIPAWFNVATEDPHLSWGFFTRQYENDTMAFSSNKAVRNIKAYGIPATREINVSGGAFNTPQILKLSGIGPRKELERLNIPVVVDLPGVGEGLQDRYEQSVLTQTTPANRFTGTANCTLGAPGDPCMAQWENNREDPGPYRLNGFVWATTMKSSVVAVNSDFPEDDDLFIVGAPGAFQGWFPRFSVVPSDNRTWLTAILKAHTRNKAGTVLLKSTNPRDAPDINFHYFDEGTLSKNASALDLQAVVEGMNFARSVTNTLNAISSNDTFAPFTEISPGATAYPGDAELANFINSTSYGHHASCTCAIGADNDPMAVLDGKFGVRGTKGLRVVDASSFPRIPGWFIVVPTMILGEKAADVILAASGS